MKLKYSIRKLSELAGVSARTLRYYDEIGLLKPSEISEAGYRYYGERELALLQQILFYRERGFDSKQIRRSCIRMILSIMRALANISGNWRNRRHMWSPDPDSGADDPVNERRM